VKHLQDIVRKFGVFSPTRASVGFECGGGKNIMINVKNEVPASGVLFTRR